MTILVTGGAGFIGSNFILEWLNIKDENVINVDKLTYAGNLLNLDAVSNNQNYFFEKADICDFLIISQLFDKYKPRAIIHFAAESHVDRSIQGPSEFINTNILGTFNLLEIVRKKYESSYINNEFRFIHISTDEVYGSLGIEEKPFTEKNQYRPNSPYSASKASSDHLVRSYFKTYRVPAIITNCSNNYGPKQHPEKLIPKLIYNILNNRPLPIYGKGKNSREWIYVKDHCEALLKIFTKGKIGEFYNIGSNQNLNNLQVTKTLLKVSKEEIIIGKKVRINFVKDRPGHDKRYALNSNKIKYKLKWKPSIDFHHGIKLTFNWYKKNKAYYKSLLKHDIEKRLGRT